MGDSLLTVSTRTALDRIRICATAYRLGKGDQTKGSLSLSAVLTTVSLTGVQLMIQLRDDLEKVRGICSTLQEREQKKIDRINLFQEVADDVLFPMTLKLKEALAKIMLYVCAPCLLFVSDRLCLSMDKSNLFLYPVSRSDYPDYYQLIATPMDWTSISAKLDEQLYTTVDAFKVDSAKLVSTQSS